VGGRERWERWEKGRHRRGGAGSKGPHLWRSVGRCGVPPDVLLLLCNLRCGLVDLGAGGGAAVVCNGGVKGMGRAGVDKV
jgi:hypothetical protein